jgi:hypothetical protein
MFIRLALSSQRKTPAYLPLKGTTALLKILLEFGSWFLPIMGFLEYRQTTLGLSSGLSSHGIFGKALPATLILSIMIFLDCRERLFFRWALFVNPRYQKTRYKRKISLPYYFEWYFRAYERLFWEESHGIFLIHIQDFIIQICF